MGDGKIYILVYIKLSVSVNLLRSNKSNLIRFKMKGTKSDVEMAKLSNDDKAMSAVTFRDLNYKKGLSAEEALSNPNAMLQRNLQRIVMFHGGVKPNRNIVGLEYKTFKSELNRRTYHSWGSEKTVRVEARYGIAAVTQKSKQGQIKVFLAAMEVLANANYEYDVWHVNVECGHVSISLCIVKVEDEMFMHIISAETSSEQNLNDVKEAQLIDALLKEFNPVCYRTSKYEPTLLNANKWIMNPNPSRCALEWSKSNSM